MRIEVWQGENDQWYWHIRSRNGKVVSDSEGFTSKQHAIRAAKACVRGITKRLSMAVVPVFTLPQWGPHELKNAVFILWR